MYFTVVKLKFCCYSSELYDYHETVPQIGSGAELLIDDDK